MREFSGCTCAGEGFTSLTALDDLTTAIPLTYAEFKIASPFPHTPLFDMAMTNKWIQSFELEQYTCYTPTMRILGGPNSDDLAVEAKAAYRKFFMRPGKLLKELMKGAFLPQLLQIVLKL